MLRLLHYPPVQGAPAAVRAGAHEDINAITLLLGAEEAGLELLDRDGTLAGDQSAARRAGGQHRRHAAAADQPRPALDHPPGGQSDARSEAASSRYSTPFFLHFAPDFLIGTLPGCTGAGRPDRYPEPITARAYLEERLREIRLVA